MSKKQSRQQEKMLKKVFIFLGILLAGFLILFFAIDSAKNYEYMGVKFRQVNEGKLVFYKTTLPFYYGKNDEVLDYNFYLRTNPQELAKVPFNGNITLKKTVVFNPNSELDCNGDGIIAVANIVQNLYPFLGAKAIRDENATCDPLGRYTLVEIKKSNVTEVNQVGKSCYEINVNDCEILKATERYMLEAFVGLNKRMVNQTTTD